MSNQPSRRSPDAVSLEAIKAQADPGNEVKALIQDQRKLMRELDRIKVESGRLDNLFSSLAESIEQIGLVIPAQPLSYASPRGTRVTQPCAAVMHYSDWHVGACQDPDEIEGVNEFSPDVLSDRIDLANRKLIDIVELHRSVYTVDELHILDTGDNISGDIHDELRITNAYPVPHQCVVAGRMKAEKIAALAQHFQHVTVRFLTADNHGRLTKKPQAKEEGLNSFNYVVGFVAREMLKEHANVTFDLIPRNRSVVDVCSRQYLLTHGHDVTGWAGIPWYGMERLVSSESKARFHDPPERRFNLVVMGHWHTPMKTPMYLINGSPQGTDAYDHKNSRRSRPCQCMWFVHPRHNEFDWNELYLD